MIHWAWLVWVFAGGLFMGVAAMALMAMSGRSEIEEDNMRLREENTSLKNINEELRLFNERQSGKCADGTELQDNQ